MIMLVDEMFFKIFSYFIFVFIYVFANLNGKVKNI